MALGPLVDIARALPPDNCLVRRLFSSWVDTCLLNVVVLVSEGNPWPRHRPVEVHLLVGSGTRRMMMSAD